MVLRENTEIDFTEIERGLHFSPDEENSTFFKKTIITVRILSKTLHFLPVEEILVIKKDSTHETNLKNLCSSK
jgi:hypothetical protein